MIKDKFQDFLSYSVANQARPGTISMYERMLRYIIGPVLGEIELSKLKITDCVKVIALAGPRGQTVPVHAILTLRRYLRYLRDDGYKLPCDWRDIKVPSRHNKEVQYLTLEEIEIVRKAVPIDTHSGLRARTVFELILHSGLRIGEVCSIQRRNIDLNLKQIRVRNCKTKDWEVVSIVGAAEWIAKYIDATKHLNPDALFLSSRNWYSSISGMHDDPSDKEMSVVTAKGHLRILRPRIGLKKHLHWHLVRKTYCTLLLRNKLDLPTVKRLARHKSERTTIKHYLAVNMEECFEANNAIMITI